MAWDSKMLNERKRIGRFTYRQWVQIADCLKRGLWPVCLDRQVETASKEQLEGVLLGGWVVSVHIVEGYHLYQWEYTRRILEGKSLLAENMTVTKGMIEKAKGWSRPKVIGAEDLDLPLARPSKSF